MKKILFTLFFCVVSLVGYSQTNFNEAEHTNISISIDSLQNEYNYLYCEFQLYKVSNGLSNLSQDIEIKCNYIDIKRCQKMFYESLYEVLVDNYNSDIDMLSSLEENYQALKKLIFIHYDNFSTRQRNVMDSNFNLINAANKKVKQSLEVYKMTLDLYKNNE